MKRIELLLRLSPVLLFVLFVTLPLRAGAAFVSPTLEWAWNGSAVEPSYNQVMMSPEAADLDGDGTPEVIFITFGGAGWSNGGILRAVHGNDGTEYFNITDPALRANAGTDLAVGDIDNDGKAEILVMKQTGEVMCFENDGTLKWITTEKIPQRIALAVADLDNDGVPEIIAGNRVFNNDGTLRWAAIDSAGYDSVVTDLDLDGTPEIINCHSVFRNDGSIYWIGTNGHHAVANFNLDAFPEVVTVAMGNVMLRAHDGTIIWGPVAIPSAGGSGPPLVADFDGDGRLDIGVAGYDTYTVFNDDGTIKWTAPIQDTSSGRASATAFDFDDDGASEIVYSDELVLRVFNGADGSVLFSTPSPSGTLFEQPIVVDVDNDGFAEIVAPLNNYAQPGSTGIEVYGSDGQWPSARKIWNQFTYHVTNIYDNGTVPRVEKNNWNFFNDFRTQSSTGIDPVPDLTVNGKEGPVSVAEGTLLTADASLALDPRIHNKDNADWWVWAETPVGTFWYTLGSEWILSEMPIVTYSGPLFSLSPRTVYSRDTLPVGAYIVHFDVDLNMNGQRDDPMFSDTFIVNVLTPALTYYRR